MIAIFIAYPLILTMGAKPLSSFLVFPVREKRTSMASPSTPMTVPGPNVLCDTWSPTAKLSAAFALKPTQSMRRLSKGMQKQAAFWLALSCCPEVILLDEPVDGLDPVMRRQVWSLLMQDVAERETTVLVSSHNLRELEDVCDHVGIMNRGKMLLERPLAEMQENTVKIQLALPEGKALPEGLEILHCSETGRLRQLILRGKAEELTARLAACEPYFMDVLPLSLEEIFIYELGGAEHEIKNILI